MTADVKDRIIVLDVHIAEFLGRRKLGLDNLVLEEFDRFVICEKLLRSVRRLLVCTERLKM